MSDVLTDPLPYDFDTLLAPELLAAQNRELKFFLNESDALLAFKYWLEKVCPCPKPKQFTVSQLLSRLIAELDESISDQINSILHHSRFQKLEASWRGLSLLVNNTPHADNIKIKLLDVNWKDLTKDIQKAPDYDQTGLFHLLYNVDFGSPGGEPFGLLLGDYYVSHQPFADHPYDDVFTLQGIAYTAAAAFAPFVCAASPQLFGLDQYDDIAKPIDFSEVFRQKEYIRWSALRDLEDSRFVAVTLPQILMRKPYNIKFSCAGGLRFAEQVASTDNQNYLWGNACFALGVVLLREFNEVGWFAHIRGVSRDSMGGGLVSQLPALAYGPDTKPSMVRMSTSILMTDAVERSLSELGFVCLSHCYDTPFSAFNSVPSLQRAKRFTTKAATANARISAMLQQILCASRFAHYIKVMIRDKVGAYIDAKDCERQLQQWLHQYTTGREDLSWEMLSRYPLREARVQVLEEPGKPGSYQSVIHLKTHYTVDHLVSELKLTTALAQAGIRTV